MLRPGIGVEPTHLLTLSTHQAARLANSLTLAENFGRREEEDEQCRERIFALKRTATYAAHQFNSQASSLEYNGAL